MNYYFYSGYSSLSGTQQDVCGTVKTTGDAIDAFSMAINKIKETNKCDVAFLKQFNKV